MNEADLYEDLAYEEAEGAADFLEEYDEDVFEEYDEFDEDGFEDDEFEEFEAFDDGFDELDVMDEFGEYDEFDEFEEDEFDDAIAFALDAEDTDEFFKKLFRGIKRIARKVAPVIGKVARIAGPILSKIPHPYAQIGATAARLLGRLRAEGATEEEALDAMAELAVRDRRALPLVAGLAARTLIKGKGAQMSHAKRKKIVKDMKTAAKVLVAKRGPKAIRALPKITKSVKRTTAMKGQPTSVKPKIVKRTAAKVARSSRLTRKLSRPSVRGKVLARRGMRGKRSYTIPGPTRITISAA